MNHTNDGFLNSILNDEDLQLMDMAVNEGQHKTIFLLSILLPISLSFRLFAFGGQHDFTKKLLPVDNQLQLLPYQLITVII